MANVYQDVLTWQGGNQLFSNVLHFHLEESGAARPDQYATELIDNIEINLLPVWQDVISTTVHLMSQKCQRITGTGGPNVTKLYAPGDFPGLRAGEIGNTSENVVLEFPVFLNGKNVTGKIFISGILDEDVIDNEIDSTVKTAANALGTTLLASYTMGSGYGNQRYVIYNRETQAFAVPDFREIGLYVGSQRRRLRP